MFVLLIKLKGKDVGFKIESDNIQQIVEALIITRMEIDQEIPDKNGDIPEMMSLFYSNKEITVETISAQPH